jgi:rhodanese-related sulfurtransferase
LRDVRQNEEYEAGHHQPIPPAVSRQQTHRGSPNS